MTEAQQKQLTEGAYTLHLPMSERTLERFSLLAERLEEGNRRLNLTRIPPEEVVTLHFLDSLTLASLWQPEAGMRLIDVGTGAGFPGLPLAIVFPELAVTLLDGTRKRLAFIDEVIAALDLPNARTLHGRAEEIGRSPEHRNAYDIATARAVAKIDVLAGWMLPLIKPGGLAVAYKSREVESEIETAAPQIASNGGQLHRVAEVALPSTDIVRKLVFLRKLRSAPSSLKTTGARRARRPDR